VAPIDLNASFKLKSPTVNHKKARVIWYCRILSGLLFILVFKVFDQKV